MVKKDKEELKSYAEKIIKQLAINKNFKMDLIETLKNRIEIHKLTTLFNAKEDETVLLSEKEIYWIAKFLSNNQTKYNFIFKIKIDDYFTDLEINECELHFIKITEEKDDVFILENVVKVNDDEFIAYKVPLQVIAESYSKGILTYDYSQQREAELTDIGIGIVKKPKEYKDSILEIEKAILEGEFIPNMITWNALDTGLEDIFEYDEENHRMIIFLDKKSRINIIDGHHRSKAITRAVEKNPDVQGYMQIKIFKYDIYRSQKFILQESKGHRISVEKQRTLEQSKEFIVSKMINTTANSNLNALYNKLSENKEEVFKYNTKIATLTSIMDVLEDWYGDVLQKRSDNKRVADYLIKFFNEFTEKTDYAFEDISIEKSREKYVLTYNNFFILLTYLAYKLYNNVNWENILTNFATNYDFSIQNPIWKELLIASNRSDKRLRKKIYNWLDEEFKKITTNNEIAVSK